MSALGNHTLHINIGYTSIGNVEIIKVSTSSLTIHLVVRQM